MRFFTFLTVFTLIFSSAAAYAAEGKDIWFFHWQGAQNNYLVKQQLKYENPRYEQLHHIHAQFDQSGWTPEQWIEREKDKPVALIERWVRAGILRSPDSDWQRIPSLIAGPNFYRLSGYDKRRVVKTVDAMHGYTKEPPFMLRIRDWKSEQIVGEYINGVLYMQ